MIPSTESLKAEPIQTEKGQSSGHQWDEVGCWEGRERDLELGQEVHTPCPTWGVGTQDEKFTELTTKDTNYKRFTKGKSERKICAKSQVWEQAFVRDKGDIFK